MPDQPPPAASSSPNPSWRNPRAAEGGPVSKDARRRFWITVLIGTFLAIATSLALWLFLFMRGEADAVFVAINIGNYNSLAYPCVPFASADGDRLSRHFEESTIAQTKSRDLLLKQLTAFAGHSHRPLVVQITALAVVQEDVVYLLPADADPDDRSLWVPVSQVLSALKKCKSSALLILNLAHPLADARLGVLSDHVAETLQKQLIASPPPFFVFCPCSAGEYSLNSELLQGSVFAYYLDKGLDGEADGAGGGRKDNAITVSELQAYVESRVRLWAQAHRPVRQTPTLFGNGKDFRILNLHRPFQPREHKADPPGISAVHKAGWELRDQWHSQRVFDLAPRSYQELQAHLLRQEERWRGGVDRNENEQKTLRIIEHEKDTLKKFTPPSLTPMSLTGFVPDGKKKHVAAARIRPLLEDAMPLAKGLDKKDDPAKIAIVKLLAEQKEPDYPPQAAAVMEALIQCIPLTERQVRLAFDVIKPSATQPQSVETAYLQRLIAHAESLPQRGARWEPANLLQILTTMTEREKILVLLADEPALLPFAEEPLKNADSIRRQAEAILLWQEPRQWATASKNLADAHGIFRKLLGDLEMLKASRRAWSEAFAYLPGYQTLLVDWPEEDLDAESAWRASAKLARGLCVVFPIPTEGDLAKNVGEAKTGGDHLEKELGRLKTYLRQRIERAEAGNGQQSMEQILCLLKTPLLTAKERTVLGDKSIELAKILQTRLEDGVLKIGATGTRLSARNRLLLRARISRDLLDLAGLVEFRTVTKTDDEASMQEALRKDWAIELPSAWEDTANIGDADRYSRIAPPLESAAAALRKHPIQQMRRTEWNRYLSFMKESCRQEVDHLLGAADGKESAEVIAFYRNAAARFDRLLGKD